MCLRVYVGGQRESVHVLFDRRYQIAASFSEEFRLPPCRVGGKAEENGSLRRVVENITRVFAGVCQWKKPGRARRGETGRARHFFIYALRLLLLLLLFFINCYFKCTFLSLELMCQRKILIFMLCILMTNKN